MASILNLSWREITEILILWFIIYHILKIFQGTKAIQVLRGIVILLFAFFLSQILRFDVLNWLLTNLFGLSVITILIIFHPEIRQGLARLGKRHLFSSTIKEEELDYVLKQIFEATHNLAKNKMGGLIVIENNDSLSDYIENGVILDARVSSDLIETIFTPNTILHDGGVIIQHGRIKSAGCIFPLSQNQDLSRIFGTRHRAALGLSEETDAIIFIVSEERQDISLVFKSNLYQNLDREQVINKVKEIMNLKKNEN